MQFFLFLIHYFLLNLDIYEYNYGYLKLQGSLSCVAQFEIQWHVMFSTWLAVHNYFKH